MRKRYIRTKDKIVVHPHPDAIVFTFKYEIVSVGDTIEELIDEYIVTGTSVEAVSKLDLFSGEDGGWLKDVGLPEHKVKIYGAIWVELPNGAYRLEPVAEMNDKRELKLL